MILFTEKHLNAPSVDLPEVAPFDEMMCRLNSPLENSQESKFFMFDAPASQRYGTGYRRIVVLLLALLEVEILAVAKSTC